ncbi:protein-disulfide reductase DsbD domain-containing protein [Puia sp. P3]|uniref:protein-disulfide reductase DsbD domain-containing protein n=1 Tax=Puia sp. P3 TaxID=3423952 RepID=UPI003D67BE5A
MYSQHMKEGGPIPTSFTFDKSADYSLDGKTVEPRPTTRMEKVFGMNVSYFERSVIFQQKVKLKKGSATVTGKLGYMTCNDKECLPPDDVRFSIPIN